MVAQHIISKVQSALDALNIDAKISSLDIPTVREFGDYSTNIALRTAKELKKNPIELAEQIKAKIETDEIIAKVEVIKPGFINISLSQEYLIKNLNDIIELKGTYGNSSLHKGKTAIVEYSSPNIAKPFTIGHLRSTIIGNAVANLLEAVGYTVKRDNHLGDWGTQFGKQIYAIKHLNGGEEENIKRIENSERPVKELVDLYVQFHKEAESNPELEDKAREYFKKLEDGDKESRELWQKCIDWSWKEFNKIYEQLGVTFTENNGRGYGEAFFEDKMVPVIEELKTKNLLKDSQGAKIIEFEDEKYPPLMIIKKDGATLYSTRDLATDKFRLEKYGKDILVINEVGAEQSLYFNQLYETEYLLQWYKPGQRVHVKHGMYRFKDQKMSTRKGNVIWLEDVLEEAVTRAQLLMKESKIKKGTAEHEIFEEGKEELIQDQTDYHQSTGNVDKNIEQVGIGAIKWNDLRRSSHLDIVFDWEDILNMQGNSGPYMQYTYVRCSSVLKDQQIGKVNKVNELNLEETILLRIIQKFPEVVINAAETYSPNIITTYLFDLAQNFNLFYQKHSILKAEDEIKDFRIALTAATAQVIKNGLHLLGIETVEKM